MADTQMNHSERESFLAALHVGMIGIERSDGPPLTVPIWYDYEPGGDLWVIMGLNSLKGRLITAAGRFSLCVQQEAPPYRYVSVEGAATIAPSNIETDLRPMARRYLGEKDGDRYTDGVPHGEDSVRVSMRPHRWFTVDYGKS